MYVCVCVCVCVHIYRVSRGNVPHFGRMFLTLKYTDIIQNTYVYPKLNGYGDNGEKSVVFLRFHVLYPFRVLLPVHCACPFFSLTAEPSTFHLHYQQMSQLQ